MEAIEFNITLEVIIFYISAIPLVIAFLLMVFNFLKERYRHTLYMMIVFLLLSSWCLFAATSKLLLSPILLIASVYVFIPSFFAVFLLIDSVTRESVEPVKLLISAVFATFIVVFSFDPTATMLYTYPNGAESIDPDGYFNIIFISFFLFGTIFLVYFFLKIYIRAPDNLKYPSGLILLGAVMMSLGSGIVYAAGLSQLLPGLHALLVGIGAVILSVGFVKNPKVAYILPFRTYRITIFETDGGIALFTYNWGKIDDFMSDTLFSGMLHATSQFMDETLKKGNVREIRLEKAILIIRRSEKFTIAYILVSTNSSRSLRAALNSFAEKFEKDFGPFFIDTEITSINVFEGASRLVEECFPFIPVYD